MISRGTKLAVGVLAALLLLPAMASAAVKTYGGSAESGASIAFDVKVSKKGVPKQIKEIRAIDMPGTCEISGGPIPLNTRIPAKLKVTDGKFSVEFTDDFGNLNSLDGKFSGKKAKKVKGSFLYANHFEAEGEYPEENCTTEKSKYSLKKGGPDVEYPEPQLARGR